MKGWRKGGAVRRIAQQDDMTDWVKTIEGPHDKIHDGDGWVFVASALADDAGVLEVRIEVPALLPDIPGKSPNPSRRAHVPVQVQTALASTVEIWKNTTKTDEAQNRVTPINNDFSIDGPGMLTICHTPGGAQAGAASLGPEYIGTTTQAAKTEVGGGTGGRFEFLLAGATLIRVTSRADNNAMTIKSSYYEHTPTPEPE